MQADCQLLPADPFKPSCLPPLGLWGHIAAPFLHPVYTPPPNLYPVFTPLSLLLHCTQAL